MTRMTTLLLIALAWPLTACGGASMPHHVRTTIPAQADADGRLLARTARLDLEVDDEDDFGQALDDLEALAKRLKGHVVSRSQDRMVFKVPAATLDEALKAVQGMGEITESWVGAVDVTAEHTDLGVRIANLEKLQGRLRQLVDQATDVKTILEVEKELGRVTTELERLQAQLRLLSGRVALAEVTVALEEEVSPGPIGWVGYGLYHGVKWLFVWD
ncbi:MAG: DUF4349 domain-containing protein [Myxococcales bacterium]|nr:DUF4349 domain-containing protein [Myxococcales bacterium]MCB9526304.1 DUF4349 domain-containing protein [Myxococcales bacterium]